jgi:hypothetical protein
MTEQLHDEVSVIAVYQAGKATPIPWRVKWKNRHLVFTRVDLCHPVQDGKTLHYVYSVCDGANYYRLDLNTRAQKWFLMEISDGLPG